MAEIQACATWVLRTGLRDYLTELVPALITLGVQDYDKLTKDDVDKIKDKLSKKALQALMKKCAVRPMVASDGGGESRKKKKAATPVTLPATTKLEEKDLGSVVFINRAPVLQLWTTCCCKILGFSDVEALAIAGALVREASEQKRKLVGLYVEKPAPVGPSEPKVTHQVLGMEVQIAQDSDDVEIAADWSLKYITKAFDNDFLAFYNAMMQRATQMGSEMVVGYAGYAEYERFRPPVSGGARGFGEKGRFRLGAVLG